MIRVILLLVTGLAHALGLGLLGPLGLAVRLRLLVILWLAFALPVVAVRLLVVLRLGLLVRVSLESYS